jgi:hypothetical protein
VTRLKPVPEPPPDLDGLWTARDAVPLVPKSEADCCARVMDRCGLAARDDARTWLTFLRALGLVTAADRGFHRTRDDPDRAALADRFREGVYAAREVLAAVEEAARTAEETFAAVESVVPNWERHKDPAWERTWRERTRRLLEWAVLVGLAERDGDRYRAVDRPS